MKNILLFLCFIASTAWAGGYYKSSGDMKFYRQEFGMKTRYVGKVKVEVDTDKEKLCQISLHGERSSWNLPCSYIVTRFGRDYISLELSNLEEFFRSNIPMIGLVDISNKSIRLEVDQYCRGGLFLSRCKNSVELQGSDAKIKYRIDTNMKSLTEL